MAANTPRAGFEVGPIRPPSEARSLLVRISRNCPWNKCAFCPVYKHSEGFSKRSVDEVLADLDAMQAVYGDAPRTVFLQDADPLIGKPDDLVAIIEGVRARFPGVKRITTYARSKTLARKRPEDLQRIREAGLDRIHVGLESGCDAVLTLMRKGITRAEQIEGGRRAKAGGFELSQYVMPGIGGKEHSAAHADDTASAVAAVEPDFVRLRTTAVVPGSPLAALEDEGRFTALGEIETLTEIRRFLLGLEGVTTRLESDHSLNLLMELRGNLPQAWEELVGICDEFLGLAEEAQVLFVLGRRLGRFTHLRHRTRPGADEELEALRARFLPEGCEPESLFHKLRLKWI